MTPVKFEGESPFALPATQSAGAVALNENVEMTLSVLVEGQLTIVRTQMVQRVADTLATALFCASRDRIDNAPQPAFRIGGGSAPK